MTETPLETAARPQAPATTSGNENRRREFLAFKLATEEYGVDILRVQEIRSYSEPTRISNAPPVLIGVVNLRGAIVPILDMRVKFNLEHVTYDALTVVIVLNLPGRVVGLIVDAVSDVISLSKDQMRPVPEFNSLTQSDHLLAIGSIDNRMITLIDIEKLIDSPDMGLADSLTH